MKIPNLPAKLLKWYEAHGRDLPWRSHDGRAETPYHTWLAEIMLQQTGVSTVIPYYARFIKCWPTIKKLAAAKDEEVMQAWAGAGYYSRARNLLKCARYVAQNHGGKFPSDIDELLALPGVGPYTANAVRAIAFDLPANVVDGNVERVMARIFAYGKPTNTPQGKRDLTVLAATLAPTKRTGDYAQGLMDLGATICTPKNPKCDKCPWQKNCKAFTLHLTDKIPVRARKKAAPVRYGVSYIVTDKQGRILMKQRPEKGLLGGLWGFADTEWRDTPFTQAHIKKLAPSKTQLTMLPPITHLFTHFKLIVTPVTLQGSKPLQGGWFTRNTLPAMATLHKKLLAATFK